MIRTRLTLWNTVVFALALTLIGTVLYFTIRSAMYRDIDDDLSFRAADMQRIWSSDHGPGRPGGPEEPRTTGGPVPAFGDRRGPFGGGQAHPHGPDVPWPIALLFQNDRHEPPGKRFFSARERKWIDDELPQSMLAALDMDPIQAKRLAFSLSISRPRLFFAPSLEGAPPGPAPEDPFDPVALKASLEGQRNFSDRTIQGHRVRILSVPLRRSGKVAGAAQVAANLEEVDSVVERVGVVMIAVLPLALLATSILGVWLTNRALKPVRDIADAAQRIEATSLSGRLPVQGRDEFAILSQRFNSMLDRLEGSFKRLAEAYEAQRRFIADASHELKTPLTTVKGRVGVALRGTQSPERYGDHLRSIGRAADNMSSIIQDLLLLARSDEAKLSLRREPYLLEELAHEAVVAATAAQPRQICVDVPEELRVAVDASLFTRALSNLLGNAIRHTPAEKRVQLTGRPTKDGVRIQIVDEGEGIPESHLPLIFDRFHRVDPSRDRASGGTGLGLSIVRSIVEAHGGTVKIESTLGAGTTVTIDLPLHESA